MLGITLKTLQQIVCLDHPDAALCRSGGNRMRQYLIINISNSLHALLLLVCVTVAVHAQGTAFTYQGKLADSGTPANGNYDFEFKLFDTSSVGTGVQQGSTVQRLNVSVVAGVFTVSLDFGACASCFNGAGRFLEISVRPTSGGAFTTLSPRQPINSSPYALKSANATAADGLSVTCVNCITSSQIQSVQGSQVTGNIAGSQIFGAIPVASVPAGSASYVQNTTSQQAMSNFNISGSGVAGFRLSAPGLNALGVDGRYLINGFSVLSNGGLNNLFAGADAGEGGASNSFFGSQAGSSNTTGFQNSFFGRSAGDSNTTGANNAFFGTSSGFFNTTGSANAIFGFSAGRLNTTGGSNAFFGNNAGESNGTGSENTLIGYFADVGANNLSNATAIGANARADASNSLVLGSINGVGNGTADSKVGIGTTSPGALLDVQRDAASIPETVRFTTYGADNKVLSRASGGTRASPSATPSGRNLLLLGALGYDGTGFATSPGASVNLTSSEIWSTTAHGARISFGTTANGTTTIATRMTIDENGNVGVGATAPVAPLHIVSGSSGAAPNANASLIVDSSAGHFVNILGSDGVQTGVLFGKPAGGGSVAGIVFNNINVTDGLQFRTGNSTSTRMAITSAGDVGIGLSAPSDKLQVFGDIRVGTGTTGCVKDANGTVIAGTCSSDARLKRDIRPLPSLLDKIVRLQPVSFYWRTGVHPSQTFGSRSSFGLVAQEVERVMPELVTEDEHGFKAVNYSKLPLLTLQAIKEQQAQIDRQQQQLSAQQQENRRLLSQVEALMKLVCADHPDATLCR